MTEFHSLELPVGLRGMIHHSVLTDRLRLTLCPFVIRATPIILLNKCSGSSFPIPSWSIEDGLARTVAWYRKQLSTATESDVEMEARQ